MSDSTAPTIVIALAVLTGVALAFMGLRIFCKARYHKKFGWDDYILGSAWVLLAVSWTRPCSQELTVSY